MELAGRPARSGGPGAWCCGHHCHCCCFACARKAGAWQLGDKMGQGVVVVGGDPVACACKE